MDMHERMQAEIQSSKQEKAQAYQEASKLRLARIITKKVNTAFIGALSKIEQKMGHLWGHGMLNPTEAQLKLRQKYKEMRNDILYNGNNQIRAIENELDQYTVNWDRYQTSFNVEDNHEDQ